MLPDGSHATCKLRSHSTGTAGTGNLERLRVHIAGLDGRPDHRSLLGRPGSGASSSLRNQALSLRAGPDLASVDLSEVHALVRAVGASAAAVARRLGTTTDAIQALLLDHPAPADPADGARWRRARYDISREQLWDLHHGQGLSFTEIGQRTGYSRTAIKDLARTYSIPMDT